MIRSGAFQNRILSKSNNSERSTGPRVNAHFAIDIISIHFTNRPPFFVVLWQLTPDALDKRVKGCLTSLEMPFLIKSR